jgi:hypothetical protein
MEYQTTFTRCDQTITVYGTLYEDGEARYTYDFDTGPELEVFLDPEFILNEAYDQDNKEVSLQSLTVLEKSVIVEIFTQDYWDNET